MRADDKEVSGGTQAFPESPALRHVRRKIAAHSLVFKHWCAGGAGERPNGEWLWPFVMLWTALRRQFNLRKTAAP